MSKNKLFKVFIMIAFIMCSCEDNFDPKMYGTLNVSNYPVTEAEYESFMMTCYMPFTTTWTYWIGAGTSGNQHGWYIPAGGVLKFFDYPTDEMAVWNNGWGGGYYFLSKADFSQCVYYTSGTLSDERPNHSGWFIYAESYAAKPYGYHLFQSTSMDGPWKERTFSGPNVKDGTDRPGARHGCIVKVNETVYQALLKAYKK